MGASFGREEGFVMGSLFKHPPQAANLNPQPVMKPRIPAAAGAPGWTSGRLLR